MYRKIIYIYNDLSCALGKYCTTIHCFLFLYSRRILSKTDIWVLLLENFIHYREKNLVIHVINVILQIEFLYRLISEEMESVLVRSSDQSCLCRYTYHKKKVPNILYFACVFFPENINHK
jgi:hypothetical protein